jgi:Tfp pilus assembly protein PilO
MDSKRKIYLTSIIFFILFCGEIFGLIPFLYARINSASADLTNKKQNLEDVQKKEQEAVAAEDEYQAIMPQLDEINSSLLDKGKVLDFIVTLEKIADKTGNHSEISVVSSAKAASKKKPDQTMEFQISLEGSFSDLVKFLSKVENMPYLNDVDSIQIKGYASGEDKNGTSQSDSNVIATTINIKVYLKP